MRTRLPLLLTSALAVSLALVGCSTVTNACASVDTALASTDSALTDAVAAADAQDFAGITAALDRAHAAVDGVGDTAQNPALTGIVGGLTEGLDALTSSASSGLDGATAAVADVEARLRDIREKLAGAQQLVASGRAALGGVCGAS